MAVGVECQRCGNRVRAEPVPRASLRATASAQQPQLLYIGNGTTANAGLLDVVAYAGFNVTIMDNATAFTGGVLWPTYAVVLIDLGSGSQMPQSTYIPASGQFAIIDFVQSGGGLIVFGPIGYAGETMTANMTALLPYTLSEFYCPPELMVSIIDSTSPISAGLPSSFSVPVACAISFGTPNPMADKVMSISALGTPFISSMTYQVCVRNGGVACATRC